ncbi:MAG: DUF222 domain-containing protein [Nesterenkonia sp.]
MDGQEMHTPRVPPKLQHLMDEPALAQAWEHQVAARQAEAAKITVLLEHVATRRAEHQHELEFIQDDAERAAVHQAALLLGFSDHTTASTLNACAYAREHLPWTWEALRRGLIDTLRLRKITTAAENFDDQPLERLDSAAALAAIDRSLADFQNWLTRFIAQLDYQAYIDQCAKNRTQRYVQFSHDTDGMSYIDARIPTVEAAAIEKRLKITARRQHATAAEPTGSEQADERTIDDRTLAQREADLFSAWLRTGDTPEEGAQPVDAKIMIMVPEATLTGGSDEPGLAADRSWALDPDQARTLAADPDADHQWYQGCTRPNRADADVDVLSATYVGRYPPQRLRDALIFRDGVCATQGCTVPAERSDIDHQLPWDAGGQTTAVNLRPLCRRHHRLKSHGFLHPPARGDTEPRPRKAPVIDLWMPAHAFTLLS